MLPKKDNVKNVKNEQNPSAGSHQSYQSPVKTPNQMPSKTESTKSHQDSELHTDRKSFGKTRITIKFDSGFPNQLYIRGKGANLSWDKGIPLKNIKSDEWVWETDTPFTQCEFKVLINDRVYENGDNHLLNSGATMVYTPHFY